MREIDIMRRIRKLEDRPLIPHLRKSRRGLLTFSGLRASNVHRCTDPKGFDHPLATWSVAEWGNACAGELGEACNFAKKLLRIRKNTRGNLKAEDHSEEKLVKKLAREIADTVIYLDLWAASEGIDLSEMIRQVWNNKAKQVGYPGRI